MEYAKSLVKGRNGKAPFDDSLEDSEESWTFIGDDANDIDLVRRGVPDPEAGTRVVRERWGGPKKTEGSSARGLPGRDSMVGMTQPLPTSTPSSPPQPQPHLPPQGIVAL